METDWTCRNTLGLIIV